MAEKAPDREQSAILMDRDGVLNVNRDDYVKSLAEFRFLPGALEAVERLAKLGLPMGIISNQQGIGKGLIGLVALREINELVHREFEQRGARLLGIYYCPHLASAGCGCRKPELGLFERAVQDHGIDLNRSYYIGDSESDACAGVRAGCTTVIVLSGKTQKAPSGWQCSPHHVCRDLPEAADWIMQVEKGRRD